MGRKALLAAALVLAACGGPGVESVVDKIDEQFGCVRVRAVETLRACDLADGTVVTVDETTSDNATDLTIAMRKDSGARGPWIVGDGFLVELSSGDLDLATEILALVGGELRP